MKDVTTITLKEMKLIGLSAITNNDNERNSDKAKIKKISEKYFYEFISKISNSLTPSITYSVYTNYTNGFDGDYKFFIGQIVSSFDDIPPQFDTLVLPAMDYTKLSNLNSASDKEQNELWDFAKELTKQRLAGKALRFTALHVYDFTNDSNIQPDIYISS